MGGYQASLGICLIRASSFSVFYFVHSIYFRAIGLKADYYYDRRR